MISPERLAEKVKEHGGIRELYERETIPEVNSEQLEGGVNALRQQRNVDDFDFIARAIEDELYRKGLLDG